MTSVRNEIDELKTAIERYNISDWDLLWCEKYCIAYMTLMTPPPFWKQALSNIWLRLRFNCRSWLGKPIVPKINNLDISARALSTAIIISYSRPWSGNRARDGRGGDNLEKRILEHIEKSGRDVHRDLHERVIGLRHTVNAHSDAKVWGVSLEITPQGGLTTHSKDAFEYLTLDETTKLLQNTQALRGEIDYLKSNATGALLKRLDADRNANE